ncbi:MAG: Omp28-related outer membrane protein [Bacteroidales bacterium]|nr:Omp28-related outer membrane protein [Bacteroidales bacterium]
MRRVGHILSFVIAVVLTSCHGFQDPNDFLVPDPQAPFTLYVDKETIESDGVDAAVLEIVDANGIVLTDEEYIRNVSIYIEELDEWRTGVGGGTEPNIFTSIMDGTYTISAMYAGVQCENTVTITSQNRSKYEVFHKNVAIYRLTGTWCQYCPYMTEALANVDEYTKNHSIVLEFHNADEFSVPYNSTMDMAAMLLNRFGTSDDGYPYCIYSLGEGSGKRTVNDIQRLVKNQLAAAPARTGIKAESTVENGKVTVKATVKASTAGKYDLGIALLKDRCVPSSASAHEDVYNDVVISISGNLYAMSIDAFDLAAGGEMSFEKVCEHADIAPGSNCKVVLFTLTESGGKVVIDNSISFKVGESLDYQYNKDNATVNPGTGEVKPTGGFVQKMLGMQFTSIGCNNCPFLTSAIKDIQKNYPGKVIPVSFHMDYGGYEDPMTLAVNKKFYDKVNVSDSEGLPMFAFNFRKSSTPIINEYAKIASEMQTQMEMYPAVCGVAITSGYDESAGKIEVTAKFKSSVSDKFRYHIFLVEDGIRYSQAGAEGDYVHDNVLRTMVGDNIMGSWINSGSVLHTGKEYSVTETVVVKEEWNPENMRVVVAMLNSDDGGETYCVNNVNECAVGASVSYNGSAGSDSSDGGEKPVLVADKTNLPAGGNDPVRFRVTYGGADVTASSLIICTSAPGSDGKPETVGTEFIVKDPGSYEFVAWYQGMTSEPVAVTVAAETVQEGRFQRHVCVMEFTGTWCAQCPDGATVLNYLISKTYKGKAFAMAFHNGDKDPFALPVEQDLFKMFGWSGYPAYVVDMRDTGLLNEGGCDTAIEKSLAEPAHCGVAVSSVYDAEAGIATVDAKVFAERGMAYRVAAYVIEDKIKGEQMQSTGTVKKDYTHRHVVRKMLSADVRGDSLGQVKAGTETSKSFTFEVDSSWNMDNLTVAVLAIDKDGRVNNMAVCDVNGGTMDYEYVNN